jgi:hypothetical protein
LLSVYLDSAIEEALVNTMLSKGDR